MFKRIDHVEIVTDKLDRTLRFYTDVLGFTLKVRENHAQADHRSQRISRTLGLVRQAARNRLVRGN
jgi:catechol 2,3-dioxygenase-like lactoylglutathione lyase family enzyme